MGFEVKILKSHSDVVALHSRAKLRPFAVPIFNHSILISSTLSSHLNRSLSSHVLAFTQWLVISLITIIQHFIVFQESLFSA